MEMQKWVQGIQQLIQACRARDTAIKTKPKKKKIFTALRKHLPTAQKREQTAVSTSNLSNGVCIKEYSDKGKSKNRILKVSKDSSLLLFVDLNTQKISKEINLKNIKHVIEGVKTNGMKKCNSRNICVVTSTDTNGKEFKIGIEFKTNNEMTKCVQGLKQLLHEFIAFEHNEDDMKINNPLVEESSKMKLVPVKWEKKIIVKKTKTTIFMWGKARPPDMFGTRSQFFAGDRDSYIPGNKNNSLGSVALTPLHIDRLSEMRIWDVCAAREGHHCLGIGKNDWCYVWGETKQVGALGLGTNSRVTTPFLIRALRKERVKQACCSALHSLCITDQLIIYGWGSKSLTRLNIDTKEPTLLKYLNGKHLKQLAACNTHSLAWNPNSIEIYSFGMCGPWLGYDDDTESTNKCGIMKFDSSISQNDGFSITFADASSQYTLVILNTGYVGACGVNEHGRMGVGKKIQSSSKVIWNRNLQNIVLCSAGSFHAGFVDTEGIVYTCGIGADFRSGHGDKETVWEPK
eukprot:496174_1